MAKLLIEATPSDNLQRYKLAVDRKRVRMGANNKGVHQLAGNCDDGTQHRLSYSLKGKAGATLSIKVVCGDETELEIEGIEIFPEGEPFAAGWKDFTL